MIQVSQGCGEGQPPICAVGHGPGISGSGFPRLLDRVSLSWDGTVMDRRQFRSRQWLGLIVVAVIVGCWLTPVSAQVDFDGQIEQWLVLGPFANDFGCSGPNADPLLGNHIAPSKIGCLYPEEEDAIDYDSFEAVSNDYVGPGDDPEQPEWRVFDDGAQDGNQDLQAEAANNGWQNDDVMSWLVSYFTYEGNGTIDTELCVGSDDGVQVWIDDQLVWTNNACRGGGVCQDRVGGIEIDPGPHRVAIAAWERGGGWNARFGFQVDGLPVDVDHPDWTFHGVERPDGLEAEPDCGESECERLELAEIPPWLPLD